MAAVLQMQGIALAHNADHIKPAWAAPRVVGRKPRPGRAAQGALLGGGKRSGGAAVRGLAAGFYFNKNYGVAVASNNIQLKPALAPVGGKHLHATAFKQGAGCVLALAPKSHMGRGSGRG